MKASIIVSDTTSQGKLLACISALCAQRFAGDYEIILPDIGNIEKEDASMLRELQKDNPILKILPIERNRAKAINRAAKLSKGRILAFTESHCIAHPTWLEKITSHFEGTRTQAVCAGLKSAPSKKIVSLGETIMRNHGLNNQERLGIQTAYFDFHNSAILKATWQSLAGVDEDLPLTCEFYLGAQISEKRVKIIRDAANKIWHINDSVPANYSKLISRQGYEKAIILQKNGAEFSGKYFPAPKLIRYSSIVRVFRIPVMTALMARLIACSAIIEISGLLGAVNFGIRVFQTFARDSHRYGTLKGLSGKNIRKYRI